MINTERLSLRPVKAEDNIQLFDYRSDAVTNRFQGFIPKTINEVDVFIAKNSSTINVPESWFQLVIIDNASDLLIGDIGLHFVGKDDQQCELGITISRMHHGLGYGTEAMKAIMRYLFVTLNKHRLFASVDPNNTSSIALLRRLGFRKEAHFKQSLYINGVWVDDVIYALIKEEWFN